MKAALAKLTDLASFRALDDAARQAMGEALAESLGAPFKAESELVGSDRFVAVRHTPTKLLFAAIPGGTFEMGLRDDDIEEAGKYIPSASQLKRRIMAFGSSLGPVHTVRVEPFLLATALLSAALIKRLTKNEFRFDTFHSGKEAAAMVARIGGFRLPSEAELEFVAREGGRLSFVNDGGRIYDDKQRWPNVSPWGFKDLSFQTMAADEWHESYDGAPSTSAPWTQGGPPGVYRGGLPSGPDDIDELFFGVAALRREVGKGDDGGDVSVRLALSLP